MNCQNCRAVMSCGCQRRVASDGKQVCSNCVSSYEQNLERNRNLLNKNNSFPQQNKPKQQ